MVDVSPGDLVFSISHLRDSIFNYHYEATLLDIPQPEELPGEHDLLTPEDQNKYLGQLEPFLRYHGLKTATWGDWLEIDALEVENSLLYMWEDELDDGESETHEWRCAMLHANLDTTVDTPMRTLGLVRSSLYMFDFGLLERTMVDLVIRPSDPDQIYAVYFMPRDGTAGQRWIALAEDELENGRSMPGIIPVEDVLLYGKSSLLVITHFQMMKATGASTIRHALERLTSAFEALSYVHSKGITINLWPHVGFQAHEASFVGSYAYWANDSAVKADWLTPGCKAPSAEPAYAPIAGRRFPRRIVSRFPPEPRDGRLHLKSKHAVLAGVWTPYKASCHPLVPSAPLLLWNFLWSSATDRCDENTPTGEKDEFEWEETILEQEPDHPSFCYGILHAYKPWYMTTDRHRLTGCSPEEEALLDDSVDWRESTTPLPYDRFKRDVYNLARHMLHSRDWEMAGEKLQEEQLQNQQHSLQYERVFERKIDEFGEKGPDTRGMFEADWGGGGHVPPDRLRRLFLRLLDTDPLKRPTAEEAAEELRGIRDAEIPRIVDLYTRWYALKAPASATQETFCLNYQEYVQRIVSEDPPVRLWAEEAVYRARKRQNRSSAIDPLLEEHWAEIETRKG